MGIYIPLRLINTHQDFAVAAADCNVAIGIAGIEANANSRHSVAHAVMRSLRSSKHLPPPAAPRRPSDPTNRHDLRD